MSDETHTTDDAVDHAADQATGHGTDAAHTAEGELHTEVGHAGGHGDTGFQCAPGLPQMCTDTFPSQIFWLVVCFALLYVLMSRLTLPKIGRVIEERRDRIANDLGKAEDLRAQSEDAVAQYEKALADARSKAHVLAQETRDRLNAEEDERKAEVEAELEQKLAAAEAKIAETKAAALASIRDVATDTAASVVEHLIGETASDGDIAAAVDAELQRRNG